MPPPSRTEHDSMGAVSLPADALWGAQTERARHNFQLTGQPLPVSFLHSLLQIKAAAAEANLECGVLTPAQARVIIHVVDDFLTSASTQPTLWQQFPLPYLQTGSGTSSNMNANEVIAFLAQRQGVQIHPNDHVNASQSSNDVIPTCIQVASRLQLEQQLLPALQQLQQTIADKAVQLDAVVKTGRTHLMDALPMTMGQELRTWQAQLAWCEQALREQLPRLAAVPQGGTAIGTGLNAPRDFSQAFCKALTARTGYPWQVADNRFAGIAGQEINALLAGCFTSLAGCLLKICNDLRWLNSGPLSGLAEIALTPLQPGSSIMPGKVNPVIPEAVAMLAVQVQGQCHAVQLAAQQGNFQLNVMLPLIAQQQLSSIELLSRGCRSLAQQAIADFTVNHQQLQAQLERNPILVTALNRHIGYERAAEIAKQAYQQQRPILAVALELTDLSEAELQQLLDPKKLTEGGLP